MTASFSPLTVRFGQGMLSGDVTASTGNFTVTQGSEPAQLQCAVIGSNGQGSQDLSTNCRANQGGIVVSPNHQNNRECLSGSYTVRVTYTDGCEGKPQPQLTFPVTVQNGCYAQTRIKTNPPLRAALLGEKLAIDGNYMVATAPGYSDSRTRVGAAYVFVRSNNAWSEQVTLVPADAVARGGIVGVAIRGDVIAIGAPYHELTNGQLVGAVFIYRRSGATWNHVQSLIGPANTALDPTFFGYDLTISQDMDIIVGSHGHDGSGLVNSGAVFVYSPSGMLWNSTPTVLRAAGSANFDEFGRSVSSEGSLLVVGAPIQSDIEPTGSRVGKVHVFRKLSGVWTAGESLTATRVGNLMQFGSSVHTDGTRIVVGSPYVQKVRGNTPDIEVGRAYVFHPNGSSWREQVLEMEGFANNDNLSRSYFGTSVAIEGTRLVVGAPLRAQSTNGTRTGGVHYYKLSGSDFQRATGHFLLMVPALSRKAQTYPGASVGLSGNQLVYGSPADKHAIDNTTFVENSGAVYTATVD